MWEFMKKIEVIGLGEVVVDWVAEVPHFPKPDEKIDAISESYFAGGVTANYLVGIARLGVECGFIGAIGKDEYGEFLLHDFKKESVDTTLLLKKREKKTPVNFIFISQGEKTIIQSPHMKTTQIKSEDLDENYFSNAKILHTTLIHPDVAYKAFEIAKKFGVKISIDLESQIALQGWEKLSNLLLQADVLIPNKEGAKTITNTETPEEAAKDLVKRGIPLVIITLGKEGVLLTTPNSQKKIPTYDVKNIVDTTGAGDTFNAAFTVAYWIEGRDLVESCKFANAAASLKIQKLGARTGMPTKEEILNFLQDNE